MNALVVGVGGLGCPALRVLVASGVRKFTLVDDDRVSVDNLHRQTLYSDDDVGDLKVVAAERALQRLVVNDTTPLEMRTYVGRVVPNNVIELVRAHDVVIEGADNLATKFLVSDAARLVGRPAVHAGVVRWNGWALRAAPHGPCLRCLFEDIPGDRVETCADAGVVGPVVGVLGAILAALALRHGMPAEWWHYDALEGRLRRRALQPRAMCMGCSGQISEIRPEFYAGTCVA